MRIFAFLLSIGSIILAATQATAWGLKTHIWIAQEVVNDATDNGAFELLGRSYPLPPEVLQALQSHANAFRMGNIGPDAIPDPIVGQTTTHPGVDNGWQTDDWLNHLLLNAKSPEELAMALGFISHAASDVFAHTYVNAFAGDVFSLTDNEVDVERRHFVLEKYIEFRTPVPIANGTTLNWGDGLSTPAAGMRDLFIFDDRASSQNLAAGTGAHLYAMAQVRRAVAAVDDGSQSIIEQITEWVADYYKLQAELLIELEPVGLSLEQAKIALDAQQELFDIEQRVHRAALGALSEANEIIQKNPELITAQQQLLAIQVKAAADAIAEAARVAADVERLISGWQSEVTRLAGDIAGKACNLLPTWPINLRRECENAVGNIAGEINKLNDLISGARLRREAAQAAANTAASVRDETKRTVDRLVREYESAVQNIANGSLETAVAASKLKLDLQQEVLDQAKETLAEVERIHGELTDELDIVEAIIDDVKEFVDRYNAITLLVDNWLAGIDKASEEYIKASHMVGRDILTSSGNPIGRYIDWFDCYGYVYVGVPIQIGELSCEATKLLDEINAKFDEAIEELPEILQWILFPVQTAKKEALDELEPVLDEARFEIIKFITNEQTADFVELLVNPENATRAKLDEVFSQDGSGKDLIVFDSVADIVDADLGLQNGILNPEEFAPLKHAVTLAKLSLLGPDQLNQLVRDQIGTEYVSIYGPDVYPASAGRFSALIGAITNIDGNHQWQAFGLPHPRRLGVAHASPAETMFGRDFAQNPGDGFRLWVDPYVREKVFLRLFPDPVMGTLASNPETQWNHYRFPECAANPFPRTQDSTGRILGADDGCLRTSDPSRPMIMTEISTPEEYSQIFFRCENDSSGRYWAMAAAYRTRSGAVGFVEAVEERYPDLDLKVWQQEGTLLSRGYWIATLAACVDREHAEVAVDMARRRGFSTDAYVWYDRLPFKAE